MICHLCGGDGSYERPWSRLCQDHKLETGWRCGTAPLGQAPSFIPAWRFINWRSGRIDLAYIDPHHPKELQEELWLCDAPHHTPLTSLVRRYYRRELLQELTQQLRSQCTCKYRLASGLPEQCQFCQYRHMLPSE